MQQKETVRSVVNAWMGYCGRIHPQQLSDLWNTTNFLVDLFNKDDKYNKEAAYMKRLFFEPIKTLKQDYPELVISKNIITWDISKLETCYYRDVIIGQKLSKEHFIDSRKKQEKKKIVFGEIVTIVSLFKRRLHKIMQMIVKDNELNISFEFSGAYKELKQLGGETGG